MLILPRAGTQQLGEGLGRVLLETGAQASVGASEHIAEARAQLDGKPAIFAAVRNLDPTPQREDFAPDAGLDWYQNYALRIAGVQQQDMLDAARESIAESIRQGLTNKQAARALEDVFQGLGKKRLETIVITETAKVYQQAQLIDYESDEDIVGYQIAAILDARCCEICAARNGRTVQRNEIDGSCPPFHPRCRCTLMPIFVWEVEEDSGTWNPIPVDAPRVQNGWGTRDMVIPQRKAA